MGKLHGKRTRVLLDGLDSSNWFAEAEHSRERDTSESTGFRPRGDAKTYVAGTSEASWSGDGQFDGDADAVDAEVEAALATDVGTALTWDPSGMENIGDPCRLLFGDEVDYTVTAPLEDVVSISLELQSKEEVRRGVTLRSPDDAATAGGTSESSAGVDNGAATGDGGIANVHVFANTLDADATITVQHSTDGVAWVDLTSQVVTAGETGGWRLTVDEGVTVNRHLRAQVDASASVAGEITAAVAFGRR